MLFLAKIPLHFHSSTNPDIYDKVRHIKTKKGADYTSGPSLVDILEKRSNR
jgi:hypothetical protein